MSGHVATLYHKFHIPSRFLATASRAKMSEPHHSLPLAFEGPPVPAATTVAVVAASTKTTGAAINMLRSGTSSATVAQPPNYCLTRTTTPVRRALFGENTKEVQEANLRRVREELDAITQEDKLRYNFDFAQDRPMEGKLEWEKLPDEEVPALYRSMTCTGTRARPGRALQPVSSPKARKRLSFGADSAESSTFSSVSDASETSSVCDAPESPSELLDNINNVSERLHEAIGTCTENLQSEPNSIVDSLRSSKSKLDDAKVSTIVVPSVQKLPNKSISSQPSVASMFTQRKRRASSELGKEADQIKRPRTS